MNDGDKEDESAYFWEDFQWVWALSSASKRGFLALLPARSGQPDK